MLYNIMCYDTHIFRCKDTTKKWNVQIKIVFFTKFVKSLHMSKYFRNFARKIVVYGKIINYR